MQVLYDAMFANLIHGLPIARAMVRSHWTPFPPAVIYVLTHA